MGCLKLKYNHITDLSVSYRSEKLTSEKSENKAFRYLPFGEAFAEQHAGSTYDTPYRFNAKELDTETGLYYYGARYYDPSIGRFLSIDPLASEFPAWNPYHYVHNNPINLTDPTGMKADSSYHINMNTGVQTTIDDRGGTDTDYYTIDNGLSVVDNNYVGENYVVDNTTPEFQITGTGQVNSTENPLEMLLEAPVAATKAAGVGLLALIKGVAKGKADDVAAKQIDNLVSLNGGKSRVTMRSQNQQIDVDLKGKAHYDKATKTTYPTPHTRTSARNFRAPNQPAYNTGRGQYRSATNQDIRMIKRYLKSKNR